MSSEVLVSSYKFRIYPSKKQIELLNYHLWLSKQLWNELLALNKQLYSNFGYFYSRSAMNLMVKNFGLFSQTQQAVGRKLAFSLKQFFKLKKQNKKGGFPRFKTFNRVHSLYYPQCGFWLDNKLKVTPFGDLQIKKHREISGKIKTLTLLKESSGKWFALFFVEKDYESPKVNEGNRVGIDLGLMNFATLSVGSVIENPRLLRKYEEKLLGKRSEVPIVKSQFIS